MPSTSSFFNIINDVYDSASNSLRMSLNFTHTHSGSGSGGQLDWDVVWSDAVHSHGTDTEGGQLDWDVVWADAIHSHGTNTEGGQLDHGSAFTSASLLDDDHPQYVQENILTTLGDIPYATGSSTWSRIAIGTADASFVVNSAGTGYTFATGIAHVTAGSYTGDTTTNRAIPHGLGITPKHVGIINNSNLNYWFQHAFPGGSSLYYMGQSGGTSQTGANAVTTWNGTSFYVGTSASYGLSANEIGQNYVWTAEG